MVAPGYGPKRYQMRTGRGKTGVRLLGCGPPDDAGGVFVGVRAVLGVVGYVGILITGMPIGQSVE